jgi:SAM-dependent methyltransferase
MCAAHIDFGRTATDYARHRAGFPEVFFGRLLEAQIVRPGLRLLDLGTGTGTLARGFAKCGLDVTGLDIAATLLEQAEGLDREAGVTVRHLQVSAEATGLPSASFEVITAGQCWHWFERSAAAEEAHRLLVPDGRIVIAHFDWLPLAGNVVAATERLILEHNPSWAMAGGTGLYPAWLTDLAEAGFCRIETFSFDQKVAYGHDGWRGRIRASAGVAASLPPDSVRRFDEELRALLSRDFPDQPLQVPHRLWAAIGTRP